MEFVLKDSSGETIGWARFEAPSMAITSYVWFQAEVDYSSSATPSEGVALFSSSHGFNAVENSVLYLDDVQLLYFADGTKDIVRREKLSYTPTRHQRTG